MATIDRYSRIQVLYSDAAGGVTPDDGQLYNGEFAWAYGDGGDLKELYIGGGESTDVTFVGAEILRSGDTPFSGSGVDNKIATTKAIYDYVTSAVGGVDAGVVSVDGVTGTVDLRGGDFISITPGTHPDKGITLSVLYDNVTLGLTLTDKLGVKDGGIGTVQLASGAVTNAKLANSSVTITAGDGLSTSSAPISLGGSATLSVNVDNSTIEIDSDSLRVKDGGITNAKLANSTFTISDGSNTSPIALGGTLTLQGTANEVTVAESAGTVTIGLPNDVTVTSDLSVGGTLEVDGNLIVLGSLTTLDVTRVEIEDPIIVLGATGGPATTRDVGFMAYAGGGDGWAGLIRDSADNNWWLIGASADFNSSTNNIAPSQSTVGRLIAHIEAGTFTAS